MAKTVFILNGDPAESVRLSDITAKLGCKPQVESQPETLAEKSGKEQPLLLIVDMTLPGLEGSSLLRRLKSVHNAPILALIPSDAPAIAEEATAAGASEVLQKPFAEERAESVMAGLIKSAAPHEAVSYVRLDLKGLPTFVEIVASATEMMRAKLLAQRAADLDLPVLLEGEPGTGKRLLAKAIHAAGPHSLEPLSILRFEAGNQTDSTGRNAEEDAERLEQAWDGARGSSLFLEEVSQLPAGCQERLNHHLARQSLQKLGEGESVRIICSSSKSLIDQVKKGRLREDLYYRINVFPIWLPPLRDRREDIPELVQHFLKQIIAEQGKPIDQIDEEAMTLLQSYVWPGNVRQLENTVFRAVALAESDRLTLRDFPQIASQVPGFKTSADEGPAVPKQPLYEGPAMIGGELPTNRAITLTSFPNSTMVGIPAMTDDGEIRSLEDIEADVIRLALGHYRGHITEVARRLGIGRSTLYRKMREFGLSTRHN